MEPVIENNTKARIKVACPGCGMDLRKAPHGGFVEYGDTYCCRGCADGTGCTCDAAVGYKKVSNRSGSRSSSRSQARAHA